MPTLSTSSTLAALKEAIKPQDRLAQEAYHIFAPPGPSATMLAAGQETAPAPW
jgi:hypothetical protein